MLPRRLRGARTIIVVQAGLVPADDDEAATAGTRESSAPQNYNNTITNNTHKDHDASVVVGQEKAQ